MIVFDNKLWWDKMSGDQKSRVISEQNRFHSTTKNMYSYVSIYGPVNILLYNAPCKFFCIAPLLLLAFFIAKYM